MSQFKVQDQNSSLDVEPQDLASEQYRYPRKRNRSPQCSL